jgi:alpha/beta superfamily hydrolase
MPQHITFTADGLILEGVFTPPHSQEQAGSLILCHPHPLRGGDMDNNVIRALDSAFAAAGFGVLRFNFRGVGDSQGRYDEGIGEQQDVKGAVAWLMAQPGIDAHRIFLAGYSFGARVILQVAAGAGQTLGFIAVAPPLLRGEWPSFDTHHGPKLIICGDADRYAPPEVLIPWVERLPEPKRLIILPNVDHFFFGHERWVGQQAVEALQALSGL